MCVKKKLNFFLFELEMTMSKITAVFLRNCAVQHPKDEKLSIYITIMLMIISENKKKYRCSKPKLLFFY